MKCLVALGLLVFLTPVLCEEEPVEAVPVVDPRPVGVIYLIQVLNRPEIPPSDNEFSNTIPTGNPYKTSKFLQSLAPNNLEQEKDANREKRSPSYGGGGGGCAVCGGGGGGYPGGGGGGHHGGGGYPGGGGGYPGGGGGHGGGFGGGGAWSQSSSSAGSWGGGGSGFGKGKYGK